MNHRRVVTTADELTNARCRHLGVLLSQVHRYLTHHDEVALAALAEHMLLLNIVMVADLLQDIVNGQRLVVNLHSTLHHTLCQSHVYIRVIDNRISQQRVNDALQVTNRTIGRFSNKLDDVGRNLQTITTTLCVEDVNAQLHIGLLQFSYQTRRETRQHALWQPSQVYWWTITGQDNLLAQTRQVIEDVEERSHRLLGCCPLLHIVNYQHINALVEVDEIVDGILPAGIGKLHLEEAGRHIQHALMVIHLLATHTNGIDQMGLTTA